MNCPWTIKYLPSKLSDLVGNAKAKAELEAFITKPIKGKALLLDGPTGTGKTAAVVAIAKEKGLELVELNASDFRNEQGISSIAGVASNQRSLFFSSKIILIDEVDGISGTKDRGGVSALISLIESSAFPVVITSNDSSDSKFSSLRKKSKKVIWEQVTNAEIVSLLDRIAKNEKLIVEEGALAILASRCSGDVRAAITDLEVLAAVSKSIAKKDVGNLGERLPRDSVEQVLLKIFKSSDPKIALSAMESLDIDLDEFIFWIEQNLPAEYLLPEERARAFDAISKADVFKGRIRRMQHWRFLAYISGLLSAGIAVAKDKKNPAQVQYKRSERMLSIWIYNQKNASRKSLAKKISPFLHISSKEASRNSLPILKLLTMKDENFIEKFKSHYNLQDEDIAWLQK